MVPVKGVAEDILDLPGVREIPYRALLLPLIQVVLLIMLYLGVRRLVRRVVQSTTEVIAAREEHHGNAGRATRLRTLGRMADALILGTVAFIFAVTGLSMLGFNVAGIIGTASVAGIAFGLGAQKMAKDMINGFFILLEDQYAVGEYVTIGSVSGTVEDLGLRTTRVRDDEGKIYFVSNGDIGQVCNHSRGPVTGGLEVSIAAAADPEKATAVLNTALTAQVEPLGLPEAPHVDGVSAIDAGKTTLKILFRTAPGQRPTVLALRLREIARKALLENGIGLG